MDFNRYDYYHYTNKEGQNVVAAVSTYAGRTVKGYAKCDPRDEFNMESGKKLAAARCNENVAEKRVRRAQRKVTEAKAALNKAIVHMQYMEDYLSNSIVAHSDAVAALDKILKKM